MATEDASDDAIMQEVKELTSDTEAVALPGDVGDLDDEIIEEEEAQEFTSDDIDEEAGGGCLDDEIVTEEEAEEWMPEAESADPVSRLPQGLGEQQEWMPEAEEGMPEAESADPGSRLQQGLGEQHEWPSRPTSDTGSERERLQLSGATACPKARCVKGVRRRWESLGEAGGSSDAASSPSPSSSMSSLHVIVATRIAVLVTPPAAAAASPGAYRPNPLVRGSSPGAGHRGSGRGRVGGRCQGSPCGRLPA